MNIRKLLVGVAGLAAAASLIGLGAGASFTDAVSATQTVTAGTMNMGIDQAGGAKSYTLSPAGPKGSTFTTGQQLVTTRNNGNIPANAILLNVSNSNNNAAFLAGLQMKIESWTAPNQGGSLVTAYDGAFSAFPVGGMGLSGPVGPNQTDPFYVTFSATNLPTAAQGGVVIPTVTVTYEG